MTTIRVVNCYYCRGRVGGEKCAPCDGEGRLRLNAEGEILGPQRMSREERGYGTTYLREGRKEYARRYREEVLPLRAATLRGDPPPPAAPPTPPTPPETGA